MLSDWSGYLWMKEIKPGLVVTNLIKLSGLGIGLFAPHGAFSAHPESVIICFAGFLMAGAEMSEKSLAGMIDRFLGRVPRDESKRESAESIPPSEGQ